MPTSEFDHHRFLGLHERLRPFGADQIKVKLISTIPELNIDAIETLFWMADTVGYETISELFFAIRALIRHIENPNSTREGVLIMIDYLLRMHDEVTQTMLDFNLRRDEITEDMIRPGSVSLELAHLEREAVRLYLETEHKEELDTTLESTQQKILEELKNVQANPEISSSDFTVLLDLLGIHSIQDGAICMKPELLEDEAGKHKLNQKLLGIGGSLSHTWQENIWMNPMFDPNLYQLLIAINYDGRDMESIVEKLAENSTLNELLSLIHGESLVGDRLRAAIDVFLDKVETELSDPESLRAARQKIDQNLMEDNPSHEEIYEILLSLLTEGQ